MAVVSLRQQWSIMREKVFGMTDRRVEREIAVLKARGVGADQLEKFREKAEMAMTEDQLQRLSNVTQSWVDCGG
jgi:hypothetical protein